MAKNTSQNVTRRKRRVPDDPEILNAEGAAKLLGITVRLLLSLARDSKVPGKKLGKEWRFRRSAILRWLAEPEFPSTIEEALKDPRIKIRPNTK